MPELLYAAGLRIHEAAELLPEHIDLDRRIVRVDRGKGGKPRIAFLTSYAASVLETYLYRGRKAVLGVYRGKHTVPDTLFGVCKGRLRQHLNDTLKVLCIQLGLPLVTSHAFRHSLGTHLLRAGCSIRHIQVILGHEKLKTTQVYTHVDKEDLKLSLDTYHPRRECAR